MADQRHRYSVKFLKGDKWLFTMSTDDRDSATDKMEYCRACGFEAKVEDHEDDSILAYGGAL